MEELKIIKEFAPILALLTFIKITLEYVRGLKWKKSEFLSNEMKDFFNDTDIKKVCAVLDWNSRTIELDGKWVLITDEILIEALKTHRVRSQFTETEAKIRDLFDHFFDQLSYFSIYIDNGLITKSGTNSYLSYYLDIIGKPGRKPKELLDVFNEYIEYYDFIKVKKLIEYNNRPMPFYYV